jgi:hypothetical protein
VGTASGIVAPIEIAAEFLVLLPGWEESVVNGAGLRIEFLVLCANWVERRILWCRLFAEKTASR